MANRVNLVSKENPPKKVSRVNVDQTATLVLLEHRERGVHLVCQALADQESLERKVVRGDQELLELMEYQVQKVSQV